MEVISLQFFDMCVYMYIHISTEQRSDFTLWSVGWVGGWNGGGHEKKKPLF